MSVDDWQKIRYGVYQINIHLVFSVKYRKKVLKNDFLVVLETIFKRVCKKMECKLLEFGGEADHMHLLVGLSPKIAICNLISRLKSASSYKLRSSFASELKQRLWGKHLWAQATSVVSCGGASLDVVKAYVKNQGRA